MKKNPVILLINPPCPNSIQNKQYILPSSLLYIGGYLKANGFDAVMLDFNIFRPWETNSEHPEEVGQEKLFEFIEKHSPMMLGFSCLFSGQFFIIRKYSELIKKRYPDLPIVIGGMHPTIFPKEILGNVGSIDYIVLGEGEIQALALARYLRDGSGDLAKIDGLAYRKGPEVLVNPKTSFIKDLDVLPFQDYSMVDLNDYKYDTSHWHNPRKLPIGISIPLISSRSCPMKCNFCSMFLIGGTVFRARSAENVFSEICYLYNEHGIHHFTFMDDNLTLNKKRVIELCDRIVRAGIKIQFDTPNGLMINSLDAEVIAAMTSAGWVRGAIAIESGSDYIRNGIIRKNLKREKIYEVVSLIRKYPQVYLKAYFLMGFPEDTSETLSDTYKMIEELDIDDPYVTNLIPFPGTPLFDQCLEHGLFVNVIDPSRIWEDTGFYMTNKSRFYIKPFAMSLDELREWRAKFDSLIDAKIKKRKQ